MSHRLARPTRSGYTAWQRATTRWADVDVYGHMNNARYFELIDTVVNTHLSRATGSDTRGLDAIGVVAEVSCRFFDEVGYPEPVDLGLVVDHIGTSSVIYRVGIFQGDDDSARAEGRFVHVYVTAAPPRHSVPIPAQIRAVVEALRPSPS